MEHARGGSPRQRRPGPRQFIDLDRSCRSPRHEAKRNVDGASHLPAHASCGGGERRPPDQSSPMRNWSAGCCCPTINRLGYDRRFPPPSKKLDQMPMGSSNATIPARFNAAPTPGKIRPTTPSPRAIPLLANTAPTTKSANATSNHLQLCPPDQCVTASQPAKPHVHAATPGKFQNRLVIIRAEVANRAAEAWGEAGSNWLRWVAGSLA